MNEGSLNEGIYSLADCGICSENVRTAFLEEIGGRSLAEFKMNAISEETWMKAARSGFRNPKAAMPTPMLSTTNVPTKFCMMVRRQRRAIARLSTSFERFHYTMVPEPRCQDLRAGECRNVSGYKSSRPHWAN